MTVGFLGLLPSGSSLVELSGVLWRGGRCFPESKKVVDSLRSLGKHVRFVTNNSTKSRGTYRKTFEGFGIEVSEEHIFGSAFAAAAFLRSQGFQKKVFIVGQKGIAEELDRVGIRHVGYSETKAVQQIDWGELERYQRDPEVGAVVVGFDAFINYAKISEAQLYLMNAECLFVATNTDSTFPGRDRIFPGGGVMVHSLEVCTGRKPMLVGKPENVMAKFILQSLPPGLDPSRVLMIGDRLNTDILFGSNSNFPTLLVFTGVTTKEEYKTSSIKPTYIADGLHDFLPFFNFT